MLRMMALSLCLCVAAQAVTVNESTFPAAPAEGDAHAVIAPRFAAAPVIDGDLDDACWDNAAQVRGFWLAGTIEPAPDQTIVWIGYDEQNLYVAWACRDRQVHDAPADHDSGNVWRQDCVELFLSPQRDPATEMQFIVGANSATYDRRAGGTFGKGGTDWNPVWETKAKRQPWGFTAEMRLPLAELTDVAKYPVAQGTTWAMKLTREDKGEHTGLRTTSWTPIGLSTNDRHGIGKLVFADRNFIANGGAETTDDTGSPVRWSASAHLVDITVAADAQRSTEGRQSAAITVKGKKTQGSVGRVALGVDTIAPAPVETTYRFTADVQSVCAEGDLVAYFVAYQAGDVEQINFKHNAGWQTVSTLITVEAGQSLKAPLLQTSSASKEDGVGGVIYIDNVRLEIVDSRDIGLDPDSLCLTGNAIDAYRTRNGRIDGTYTYTQPLTTDPWFPHYFVPGTGPKQDFGLYRGDVPFDKGRLTDGHTATTVTWPAMWEGHQGHDITFDLKDEYIITRVVVKATWAGLRMNHLWFKSPGEPVYTLVASVPDKVAFKTFQGSSDELPRVDERVFNGINQAARWVRVQSEARSPAQLSEIEIWGRPLGGEQTPKRIAYRQAGGAAPVTTPANQPEPTHDVPPVFPLPQEIQLDGTPVALADGLTIAYEPVDSDRAKTTAEVLRDELMLCFGLRATVQAAGESVATILIGEAVDSPRTQTAMRQIGQTVTADSPGREGYVLAAADGRVVIAGSDARGAFYGVQSLLTLTRRGSDGGWETPGALVRDRPAMNIRIIEGRAIPSRDLVRALARFRVNYYTAKYQYIHQTVEHDAFAERYFVSFVPFLDFNTTVLREDPTLTERPADEALADVPEDSRRNANVGHPRTWEIYFDALDKWLPHFHGDILYIGMDETHHYSAGSRWNVSPESRALNMSAGALLAYTINKIDKKAKEYGKRLFMHDTPFCRDWTLSYPGDPDPSWRKAIPLLPKDLMFNVWHWNKQWVLEPLGKEAGFDLVYLCTGDRDWRPLKNMDPNEDYPPTDFPGYFAGINNYMAESSFTPSKLLETMWVGWNPQAPRPKGIEANAAVAHYVMLWNQLHLGQGMPPSISASASDFRPVDISAAVNRSRIDEVPYDGEGWVDMGPNMDMRALPSGDITMAGVPFHIIDEAKTGGRSVAMVQNLLYTDRTLPDTVTIDTPGLKAASLVFLHCLDNAPGWNYLRRDELAGFYFVEFEDGTYDKLELKYGTSLGTWDGQRYPWEYAPAGEAMTYGRVAWTGQTTAGLTTKLYKTEWVNPKPSVPIARIVMRSTYDPTQMNPMLLAVTATDARLGVHLQGTTLPPSTRLTPAQPVGEEYDLAGGRDESELRYIAPDGTIISAESLSNHLSERTGNALLGNDWRSYVGLVTMDGRQAARTEVLHFTFPKPTRFTGILATGRFREQRKAADFPSYVYNYFVDVSNDGGKTWTQVGAVHETSPEEHGPQWLPLPDEPVQHVRLRQTRCEGTPDYHGFSRVRFFRKP